MPVEERSLSSETTPKVMRNWRLGNLRTPKYVQELQTTLHAKAKERSELRFHALYDKIYHRSVLLYAYQCCRRNKGAAGTDGQTFDDIELYGVERWLGELAQQLREGAYVPKPVRRVHIPKPNGKTRPLGIACLKDRVFPAELYRLARHTTAQSGPLCRDGVG